MAAQTWLGAVDVGFLSDAEREMLLNVMQRDEKLRLAEQYRVQKLRNSLRNMRRKGAKQAERSYSMRACGRCSAPTGVLFNKAVLCCVCNHKICQECREECKFQDSWRCVVCSKEAKLKAETGDWFYDTMRPEFKAMQPGPELIKEAVIHKPKHFSQNGNNNSSRPQITCTPATSDSSSVKAYQPAVIRKRNMDSSRETEDTGSSTESQRYSNRRKYGPAETGSIKSLKQSRSMISESECSTTSSVTSGNMALPPATRHTLPRTRRSTTHQKQNGNSTHERRSDGDAMTTMPHSNGNLSKSNPNVSNGVEEESFKFEGVTDEPRNNYNSTDNAKYLSLSRENISSNSSITTDDQYSDISAIANNIKLQGFSSTIDDKTSTPGTFELMPSSPESQQKQFTSEIDSSSPEPVYAMIDKRKSKLQSESKTSVTSDKSKSSSLFKRLNPLVKHRDISMSVPAINTPAKHHRKTSHVSAIEESERTKSTVSMNREISSSLPGFRKSLRSFGSSTALQDVTITGEVRFSLNYNYKANVLLVNIVECRNIATADRKRQRSDPYVKCYLLPDRTIKRKTIVKKHTTCPVYNQCLKFQVNSSELSTRVLQLSVWNAGTFSRNLFLGQVLLPLDTWEVKNTNENWFPLRNREAITEDLLHAAVYKGDIVIGLKYTLNNKNKKGKTVTNYGFLDVMIHQAKNLTPVRSNGSVDAFVKISLKPDKQYKEKTSVISKTTSPIWNAQFHIPMNQPMENSSLQMVVYHKDKLSGNTELGACRLNLGPAHAMTDDYGAAVRPPNWMDATDKECDIWRRAIDNPETWVDDTLVLRQHL